MATTPDLALLELESVLRAEEGVASSGARSSSPPHSAVLEAIYSRQSHLIDRLVSRRKRLELREVAALGNVGELLRRLERGSDPETRDADGWAPLHHAAFLGRAQVVDTLLEHGARVDIRSDTAGSCDGCTSLHLAIAGGHAAVVDVLLANGANPNARDDAGYAPLHLAVELGHLGIVKRLLRAGCRLDPLAGDDTPLGLAIRQRQMQIAAILRQCGAST